MKYPASDIWRWFRATAWRRRFHVLFGVMLYASCVAVAAVVSMHPPASTGDLHIPVMLYGEGDELISGLQFDVNYDPTQFELVEVSAGNAATSAGKEVILSETVPGQGRILITGFNNIGMTEGQVATFTLRPIYPGAAQSDLSLRQILASDPDGNSLSIGYADLFQYPPASAVEVGDVPDTNTKVPDITDPEDGASEDEVPKDASESPVDDLSPDANVHERNGTISTGIAGTTGFSDVDGNPNQRTLKKSKASSGAQKATFLKPSSENGARGRKPPLTSAATPEQRGRLDYESPPSGNSSAQAGGSGSSHTSTTRTSRVSSTTPDSSGVSLSEHEVPSQLALHSAPRALPELALDGKSAPEPLAYSLALAPREIVAETAGRRYAITALIVLVLIILLTAIHRLLGPQARAHWRRTR